MCRYRGIRFGHRSPAMATYLLRFWARRSDDDFMDDDSPVLWDPDCPPEFMIEETGETRDADGDRENRSAPWWDVGALARIEADSPEVAWKMLERELTVVERRSTEVVASSVPPVE